MDKLPGAFVLEGVLYSAGSKQQYYRRESGKPIKIISENQFTRARDQFLALRKSIKPKPNPNPKPKHPKSVKYDGNDLSLTEKQVDFLKALDAVISLYNFNGNISVSNFMEKTNSYFHNNPMAVGAMLTTLQHKNVLATWKEESTNTRVVRIEKLGLDALKQIGGSKPCK